MCDGMLSEKCHLGYTSKSYIEWYKNRKVNF